MGSFRMADIRTHRIKHTQDQARADVHFMYQSAYKENNKYSYQFPLR